MSETPRRYSGPLPSAGRRRKVAHRHHRLPIFAAIILALVAYLTWATRDSHPLERFVPPNQKFGLVVPKAAGPYEAIDAHPVWSILPDKLPVMTIPKALYRDRGMPAWVVNNIVTQQCYLTGNDLHRFQDTLFYTKMTRVGTLIECVARWGLWTEEDHAGGLKLRRWKRDDVYYAVRGRILIASASRDALIRALTLREDDAVDPAALATQVPGASDADIQGSVTLTQDDPLGTVFRSADLALRIQPREILLKCRATMTQDWEARFAPLLEGVSPQQLAAPLDEMLALSGNLGKPFGEVCLGVKAALTRPLPWEAHWQALQEVDNGAFDNLTEMVKTILGPAGPGFQLSWHGMDLNEIGPVPEFIGLFDVDDVDVDGLLKDFPLPPEVLTTPEPTARYDQKEDLVSIPLLSGPSLEPTAARWGDALLISNSRTVVQTVRRHAPAKRADLAQPGNLCLRIRPRPCVQTIIESGRVLAAANLLTSSAYETLMESSDRWLEQAGQVEEITCLASRSNTRISIKLSVRYAAQ